jgi:hypothetical protein
VLVQAIKRTTLGRGERRQELRDREDARPYGAQGRALESVVDIRGNRTNSQRNERRGACSLANLLSAATAASRTEIGTALSSARRFYGFSG